MPVAENCEWCAHTSSASTIWRKFSRCDCSTPTLGMSETTMDDHALYKVSSQMDVAKQVMSSGSERRFSSASRSAKTLRRGGKEGG